MLVGGGVNAAVQVGDEGVLVVDTMTGALADKMLAEIRKIAGDKPIALDHQHARASGPRGRQQSEDRGSRSLDRRGKLRRSGVARAGQSRGNHRARERGREAPAGTAADAVLWRCPPKRSSRTNSRSTSPAKRSRCCTAGNAHTDGDLMVFFRKSDVIGAGDVFVLDSYPGDRREARRHAATACRRRSIADRLAIPEYNSMGGTCVIPGHGRLCDEIDVVEYRDMMTIIRDRIARWWQRERRSSR